MPQLPFVTGPVEPFLCGLQVHTFHLPNGLAIKVVPDHSAPVVAYQTWYRVGSSDEEVGKTGLAHLFEHLMFKGTECYGEGEYQSRLDALGAAGLNAWTWLDQTVYLQAVPVDALDEVARLESVRMRQLLLDEQTFESERQVVMNERRWVVDNDPDGTLSELLFASAFVTHPYGWPTIGWMEDIEALDIDDARAFYRRHYAPDQATVIVVGDVEPGSAAAVVARHYGELPAAGGERIVPPVEPPQRGQVRREHSLPITADRLLVGFKAPAFPHPDTPALLVLDAVLTQGRTGRLQRALRDAGYAAEVGGSLLPLRQPSLYELSVRGRPGIPAEVVEEALWAELARIRTEGVGEGELAMGIAQWQAATFHQLGDALGKASFLGWSMTHTGDHRDGLAQLEAVSRVTSEDVQRVAAEVLIPERSTVVVGRAAAEAEAVALPPGEPVEPAPKVDVPARARGGAPALERGVLDVQEVQGAALLRIWDPSLPLVHFRLLFPAGAASDPGGEEGLANLTGAMLLRGTARRSRREFEEALEQLGASVGVSVGSDGLLVSGSGLSETWPQLWALLTEALTAPAFPPDELSRLVDEVHDALVGVRDDDDELARVALSRRLYGPAHPYGRDPRGTLESIRAIGREDLVSFHRDHLRAGGALVALAGDLDDQCVDDVAGLVRALEGQPVAVPPLPPCTDARRPILLVDKPDRTQAQVRLGQVGVDPTRPDFPAFLLANDAFGVGFAGRLMKEIRVKRGWSYFAYSSPSLRRRGGEWTAGLAPSLEQATGAIALVLQMAEGAVSEGFSEEEIEHARAARLKSRPFMVDTATKRLDLELRRRRVGYDALAALEAMEQLGLAEIDAAFSDLVRPDALQVVVVATADALQEELEAALGSVEVVSAEAY